MADQLPDLTRAMLHIVGIEPSRVRAVRYNHQALEAPVISVDLLVHGQEEVSIDTLHYEVRRVDLE